MDIINLKSYVLNENINNKKKISSRYPLHNYKWSENYFKETKLQEQYKDFVGWQYKEYSGNYINLNEEGFRRTTKTKSNKNKTFIFFGGSAMWGYGVSDDHTIPSLFAQKTGIKSLNYAVPGFTSRNSLSLLINLYNTKEKSNEINNIVFYDGYNDTEFFCISDFKINETRHEKFIIGATKTFQEFGPYSLKWGLIPVQNLVSFFKEEKNLYLQKEVIEKNYIKCSKNDKKADKVAKNIVENWKMANAIAESNNDNFIAVLQPTAYYKYEGNNNKLGDINKEMYSEFKLIYSRIKTLVAEEKDLNFIDLSEVIHDKEFFFTAGHLLPKGNLAIIDYLTDNLKILKKY
tara:strand:+ start:439 stop:1479 length:1041 start_codon:yes stop_codon:yes gene_type:complete